MIYYEISYLLLSALRARLSLPSRLVTTSSNLTEYSMCVVLPQDMVRWTGPMSKGARDSGIVRDLEKMTSGNAPGDSHLNMWRSSVGDAG
jgi:hypothetical protein